MLTDLACDPAERAQLSTCEWLATMDGLLVGELIHIRVVQRARDEVGEPLPNDVPVVRCEGEAVPALEVEIAPRMRFGAASNNNVTRVTVAPTDLMHWIPEAQVGDYWGGIPDGVQERAADDLHAGTGRLMPRSWRNRPGQTLVLPIVAGGEVGGERRYGLGGHPIGLLALDRAEGAEHRVLFQHSDDCLEPYTFGDNFRDQAPDDFLDAVAACYASGLPDPPAEGIFLPEAPLPDAAFDSLCRDAR